MKCEEVRDELIAYTRGELPDSHRAAVEEHLVRCAGCTKELEGARQVLALTQMADDASIAAMAESLIANAVKARASDIHIESPGGTPGIRIRVDGALQPGPDIHQKQYVALVTRLKLMAGLEISQRSTQQDGRILFSHEGREFDLRITVFPFIHGEGVVMRILDRAGIRVGLDKLGLHPDTLEGLESLLTRPQGLILSTGPVGSGKTTTLYSMLERLNRPELNLLTIEDPVEVSLPGLNQAAVRVKEGVTFASALRSFMRHDPDILMVGEVRDLATMEGCIQAALTGHLVLACLHPEDTAGALVRMMEMGVEPMCVASSVVGVLAQRLVRMVCPLCKEAYTLAAEAAALLGLPQDPGSDGVTLYRGRGCDNCRGYGFRGRTGLFELLVMDETIKDLVLRRATAADIRAAARAAGMRTLREDGLRKALDGITTIDEVVRCTPAGG